MIIKKTDRIGGRGRKHYPTDNLRRQVRTMAETGLRQAQIAHIIGLDPKTMAAYYNEDYFAGKAKGASDVLVVQKRIAMDEEHKSVVPAAQLWLKATGQLNEGPQVVNQQVSIEAKVIDAGSLGFEQRQALKQLLLEAKQSSGQIVDAEVIEAEETTADSTT